MNSSDSYGHGGGSFKTWLLGGSDRGRRVACGPPDCSKRAMCSNCYEEKQALPKYCLRMGANTKKTEGSRALLRLSETL